jgi:Spy/CpxP family protein refolding chaperone
MEKFKIVTAIFFGVLFFFPPSAVQAQEEKPLEFEQKSDRKSRPNLLAELNLTSEQIREIRRINQENRPSIRLAHERLRDANRNLDKAIYADNIDEAALQILVQGIAKRSNRSN